MMCKNSLCILFSLFFGYAIAQTNIPPTLTATGDQYYCPQTQLNVVTDFNIIDPDDTEIEAVYIQISTGYVNGQDSLILTGSNPNISASWNISEGKLTLESSTAGSALYIDLIAAVKNVVFQSTSANPTVDKSFSITIGDANYLPSSGHFYEYVPAPEITWNDAKIAAENRTYFSLQGYLATITSAEEAQLSGEQAEGQGWIGGSDDAVEGTWRWVTGPEAGQSFWFGLSGGNNIGADFTYENWANNEPNDWPNAGVPDEENYLHVYDDGSWNDYPNYNAAIQGYIVEYGGTPGDPVLNISASTTISMVNITGITENNTCDSGSLTLSATSNYGDILWFDSLTSTTPIFTGTSFTTPNITSTTTYYILPSVNGCTNGVRTQVTATIYNIPTITTTTGATICESGSAILNATASAGTINWYNSLASGTPLATGTSFTTPTLTTTTTYYVDATENGCTTTTRTPVEATVQNTATPTGTATQTFCDIENATLANLIVVGTNIQWYANSSGGSPLDTSTILADGSTYYATQTVNNCESPTRLAVNTTIYKTVTIPSTIPIIKTCDTNIDGDDTNGFSEFDLTLNESTLLNGESISDFTIRYFTDASYLASSEILNPYNFSNTLANNQTIYVRVENNLDASCYKDSSFEIEVTTLPVITSPVVLKNCDEDGIPDGFTNYNLEQASPLITNNNSSLTVTYFLSYAEADTNSGAINPSPFNNASTTTPNTVFARVENSFGCHRVATINLQVSTTSFPAGYTHSPLEACDTDNLNDGIATFDLTTVSNDFIALFPPTGQTLTVHYYRNLTDAELEQNEILPQNDYRNETPYSQSLFVRVESELNEECFGIGEYLTLNVQPRPEFEVISEAIVCLNNTPLTLEPFNALDNYTYVWKLNGATVGTNETLDVYIGGEYKVFANSSAGCESFEKTINISESNIATITQNDITVTDDSNNNSIILNTTNLGIGDYEFALDDEFGLYQDEPYFDNVTPGIRTIFIRDKNNCGTFPIQVSVIGFPKYFTPNNDGTNDTWNILGATSNFFTSSQVYIFDRFGKLVAKFDTTNSNGWDGTYNGNQLLSTDYWFKAQLIDNEGNAREKSGHFSLIRH
ncbi:T9SS type B sorting domain-containing protein [Lutibacter sp. TH_r2]|uniref:Ig-like domain-containing protein n=1 Tax=Lutibacter sp. TH_r2 TaxID=3082083 RepID=UPI002955C3E1|nr:T9SS type B sorting domain-containing protein [Lutibacter sp. TH_r2]MDV7186388.1 T9SS type B sorting domain-containing protein [Lutibacter sp. TH_r2]